ncbi:venom allergen-like protein vap-2, partial [Aphelenchoides avenae]
LCSLISILFYLHIGLLERIVVFVIAVVCAFVTGAAALTATERSAAQSSHNNYRTALANGQAPNNDGTTLPGGANIFYLQYDARIESIALNWANGCVFKHSPSAQRNCTAENLYTTSSTTGGRGYRPSSEMLLFFGGPSLAKYGANPNLNLTTTEFNQGIGHWSQMAWAKTVKLGCGVKSCPGVGTIVVYNYSRYAGELASVAPLVIGIFYGFK